LETYLTIEGLANYLQLSVQTVRRYVLNREVPYHKIKKVIRFRVSEIEKWVDEGGLIAHCKKQKDTGDSLFNDNENELTEEKTDCGEAAEEKDEA
jgi:excisionase family DNA binding protein